MVTQNSVVDKYGRSQQCACYRHLVLPKIDKKMEPCVLNA